MGIKALKSVQERLQKLHGEQGGPGLTNQTMASAVEWLRTITCQGSTAVVFGCARFKSDLLTQWLQSLVAKTSRYQVSRVALNLDIYIVVVL